MYVYSSKFLTKRFFSICATFLLSFLLSFAFFTFYSYATGWSFDEPTGIWTYVEPASDGPGYSLKKGWHHDPEDGHSYYLHDETGHMLTGYQVIGDKLCYFKEEPNLYVA